MASIELEYISRRATSVTTMANPSEENDLLFQMIRRDDLDFLHYIMSHDENALDCTSQTSGRHLLDYAKEVASERMLEALLTKI